MLSKSYAKNCSEVLASAKLSFLDKTEHNAKYASLEQQTAKAKQELGTCQSSLQQSEKKFSQLVVDYRAVEDELEETKKTLFEMSSQRDNSATVKELQAENQRLLAELERAKQSRVLAEARKHV